MRWLENRFQVRANGSSLRQEVLAGLTTFAAMAYILAVHPAMLAQTGIGLFIAFIGLSKAGIVVDAPTLVALGSLRSAEVLLTLGGLTLGTVLLGRRFAPGLLIAIALITALGLFIPASDGGGMITGQPSGWIAWPASMAPIALEVDWGYPFREWQIALPLVLAFLFVDLFDSLGTLLEESMRRRER